ncbi:GntR family negative regulator for fad regulon and positive regulator of fabA [Fictibacillus halophilus]|uniref:GntR family negative regulator for fad regulon and positive regulator of fabA n=1 Tax=Fictibacillus halophilus TaxID=1610490 RepID=A0ABV2LIK6_9BACL
MGKRSSEIIGQQIIQSILEGKLGIHESMLSERDLSSQFDVGRPTIREALQRLERDGWITIHKGMPATVNDYWKQGNLMTIVNMLELEDEIPDDFVLHMLQLRISLTPAYIRDAAHHNRLKLIALFSSLDELKDEPNSFAIFDWNLQQDMAHLSPNPIYRLILNSFKNVYYKMALKYFADSSHRSISKQYYFVLLESILMGDIEKTEKITQSMMEKSLDLWKKKLNGGETYEE